MRRWSLATFLLIALIGSFLVPTFGLHDSDDEVTVEELSSDVLDPKLLALVTRAVRDKDAKGDKPVIERSNSMYEDLGEALQSALVHPVGANHSSTDEAANTTAANLNAVSTEYTTIPADSRLPAIQTVALRKQQTLKMKLSNGMGVNIVHNPDLESSSLAVSMQVGSWRDPVDAPGMAHFIEHMLFMGTKQHPKPGNFDDFLSAHGAQISNAMTGSQSTTYSFAAPHAAFAEGVTRFSEFFTDPLFDSHGANKEMHAVNQEFEMHKDQDMYRMYHVEKEISNPAHPCQRFTIGNLETLGNVTHDALISWYKAHYSANLIHVAVYTAEPLDKVAQLVSDRFSPVQNRGYTRQNVGHIPTMDVKLAGHIVHVKPLTNVKHVSLKWDLPKEYAHMDETSPGRFIAGMLGDEGPNSLLAYLRSEHLAISLSAGLENSGRDNALFSISITLSQKGMDQMDDVIAMCFRAIAQFSKEPPPHYMFEQAALKDANAWKFQWRTGDVFGSAMSDAQGMIMEPIETYPVVQSIIQAFDPDAAVKILKLLTPNTTHISVMGDDFNWNTTQQIHQEKYYNVTYAITKVPQEHMDKWMQEFEGKQPVGPDFQIPAENEMIPANLAVSQVNPKAKLFPEIPEMVLVSNDSFGLLYLKTDDVFGDPYISSSFEISTDAKLMEGDASTQAKAIVTASVWLACVEESLKTETWAYAEAGLSFGLGLGKGTNLAISMNGMNPSRDVWNALLEKIVSRLTQDMSIHTTQDSFEMIFQAVSRSLHNGLKSGPSAQASRNLWALLSNTRIPLEHQITALAATKYDDVVAFGKEVLKRVRVKGFFYGQISGDHAMQLWNHLKKGLAGSESDVEPGLAGSTLPEAAEFVSKFRVLPEGQGPYHKDYQGDARGNSTILVIDGGHMDCADRIGIEMLYKEVRQDFFNTLRTKQQTGYIAQTSVMQAARRTIAMFVVVSSWAGPGDLLGRYEAFIKDMLAGLRSGKILSPQNFATIKESLLAEFSKPIANIAEMAGILQDVVKDYDGDFDAFKKREQIIKAMDIKQITSAAEKMFGVANTRRLAVLYSPDGVSPGAPPAQYQPFNNNVGAFEKRPAYTCNMCQGDDATCNSQPVPAATNMTNANSTAKVDDATEPALPEISPAEDVWDLFSSGN
jgi:insulysin